MTSLTKDEITGAPAEMPALPFADPVATGYPPELGQKCRPCGRIAGGIYMRGGRIAECGRRVRCSKCGLMVNTMLSPIPDEARAWRMRVKGEWGHRDDYLLKKHQGQRR